MNARNINDNANESNQSALTKSTIESTAVPSPTSGSNCCSCSCSWCCSDGLLLRILIRSEREAGHRMRWHLAGATAVAAAAAETATAGRGSLTIIGVECGVCSAGNKKLIKNVLSTRWQVVHLPLAHCTACHTLPATRLRGYAKLWEKVREYAFN